MLRLESRSEDGIPMVGNSSMHEVELENLAMLEGRFVDVVGDDDLHIEGHAKAISSEHFQDATSQGQMMLHAHLAQHLLKKNHGSPVIVSQRRDY